MSIQKYSERHKSPDVISEDGERLRVRGGRIEARRGQPYWVVIRLSNVDVTFDGGDPKKNYWRRLFRHASQEDAEGEAKRLSLTQPGKRFNVFASVASFKIEQIEAAA